jgi:O-acetylserine/cysteine efflux transporter
VNIKDIILAIFVAFIWGGYIAISKSALNSFPPLLLGGLRFFIVFIITSPFIFKAKIPKIQITILSVILFLNLLILHHAIKTSNTLMPLIFLNELAVPFSALLGILFLKEKFMLKDGIGIFIAIIGSTFIAKECINNFSFENSTILIIIASLICAFYNLLAKKIAHYNIFSILSQLSLLTAVQFFIASYFQEDLPLIENIHIHSIYSLIYLSVICSVVGFYIWFYLLNKYPLGKVTPFILLSPIFGCIMTMLVFNEPIDPQIIPSGLLIILGVAIIELQNDRKKL